MERVSSTNPGKGEGMDAWSTLLILASSVSPAGLLASFRSQPVGRLIREREILEKGIQRSLSDLNYELVRRKAATAQTAAAERAALHEEIKRLTGMKADLLERVTQIRNIPQEEWNRVRDETLERLHRARGSVRARGAGAPLRPG
jgi:hypothetical protein